MSNPLPLTDLEQGIPPSGFHSSSDDDDLLASQPVLQQSSDQPAREEGRSPSVFSKAYYQRYFDLSTEDLLRRLLQTIILCAGPFYPDDTHPHHRPDLYGPFWIVTTLVLMMGVVGNAQQSDGALDILKVTYAAITFYLALALPPLIVKLVLSNLGAKRSLVNIMSLYGYSFLIYIICAPIALIPIPYMALISVCVAFTMSTLFLVKNVYLYMARSGIGHTGFPRMGLFLLIGIIAIHAGIAIITYFFFFKDYMPDKGTNTP